MPGDLIGERVTLYPYLRQHSPRDMIYLLWLLIERENDWRNIFWADTLEPDWTIGDLPYFVHYVHGLDPKIWFMIVDNDTNALIGAVWFANLKDGEAEGNMWMARGHRHKAREVTHLATKEGFRQGFTAINCITPHIRVANMLWKCGYGFEHPKTSPWHLRKENYGKIQCAEDRRIAV